MGDLSYDLTHTPEEVYTFLNIRALLSLVVSRVQQIRMLFVKTPKIVKVM